MRLGGQKVVLLPVQVVTGFPPEAHARLEAELLFALGERDARVTWVAPEALERALRRSPGFAGSPRALPSDPLLHHGERRVVGALAGELRRYSALTGARLLLLPRSAAWVPAEGGGEVRLSAALLDARTGDVLWWGEAAGERRAEADALAVASAAAALAERVVAAPER